MEFQGRLNKNLRYEISVVGVLLDKLIQCQLICPPRDVKAFCVIVANDARTYKYPSKRTAQVTVWDVPGVWVPEGCTQSPFVPGQRYLVS